MYQEKAAACKMVRHIRLPTLKKMKTAAVVGMPGSQYFSSFLPMAYTEDARTHTDSSSSTTLARLILAYNRTTGV